MDPKFLRPKFLSNQNLFRPKFFLGLNFFWTKIFYWPKIIFGLIFFQTQNDVWREKTKLLNFKLSKLARPKVLLKLEFDTKDQVLFAIFLWHLSLTFLTLQAVLWYTNANIYTDMTDIITYIIIQITYINTNTRGQLLTHFMAKIVINSLIFSTRPLFVQGLSWISPKWYCVE